MDLSLDFLFCSINHISVWGPVPLVLMNIALQYSLKSGRLIPSIAFFFFNIALAIPGLLFFHSNYEIISSSSLKNTDGSLNGIESDLQIVLGSTLIFNIFIIPIKEHGIFLNLLVSFFFNFFHQYFIVFCIQVSLGQFLPKDFILSIALVIICCNFSIFIGQIQSFSGGIFSFFFSFFMQKSMSSTNNESYTSFPIWIILFPFFFDCCDQGFQNYVEQQQ